jgi:hypothetical protein
MVYNKTKVNGYMLESYACSSYNRKRIMILIEQKGVHCEEIISELHDDTVHVLVVIRSRNGG